MDEILCGVFGASGFGREVMPLLRQENIRQRLVFVDDAPPARELNGHVVLSYEEFLRERGRDKRIVIAIANAVVRKKLEERCQNDDIQLRSVIASNVIQMDDVIIGEGAILCPFVSITSNVRIGRSFHANIYSYVAHDCIIGDYVTFAPGVKCNGNVRIEDGAYVGTGAVIKQGSPNRPLIIGAGAVIGMGSVVTKSVPPRVTVIGNPAAPLSRDTLRR